MIQLNLLPDVKLDFMKTKQLQRFATTLSVLIAGGTLAIFLLLFFVVHVVQKSQINNLNEDIKAKSSELQSFTDLNKVLTVQNQLNSLPDLHNEKPVTSRLAGYLQQVTPAKVSIATLEVDFQANTIVFTGAADSLNTINKFVDTLKFTDFRAGDKTGKAFTEVVLSNFGRDDKGASYNVNVVFDPLIFDSANNVSLTVPSIITTRSETEKPGENLFQPLSNTNGQGQ